MATHPKVHQKMIKAKKPQPVFQSSLVDTEESMFTGTNVLEPSEVPLTKDQEKLQKCKF